MSVDEDLFLKEIKYDDTILDNEETLKYIDNKRPMIKIANNDMCKTWLKNKKRNPITNKSIKKNSIVYKSFKRICKDDDICDKFRKDDKKNPMTNKKIKISSGIHKRLSDICTSSNSSSDYSSDSSM
jgi:hypothetical protein